MLRGRHSSDNKKTTNDESIFIFRVDITKGYAKDGAIQVPLLTTAHTNKEKGTSMKRPGGEKNQILFSPKFYLDFHTFFVRKQLRETRGQGVFQTVRVAPSFIPTNKGTPSLFGFLVPYRILYYRLWT